MQTDLTRSLTVNQSSLDNYRPKTFSRAHDAESNFQRYTFIPVRHIATNVSVSLCVYTHFCVISSFSVCFCSLSLFITTSAQSVDTLFFCSLHHFFLCSCVRFVWCVLLRFYWISQSLRFKSHVKRVLKVQIDGTPYCRWHEQMERKKKPKQNAEKRKAKKREKKKLFIDK